MKSESISNYGTCTFYTPPPTQKKKPKHFAIIDMLCKVKRFQKVQREQSAKLLHNRTKYTGTYSYLEHNLLFH